MKIALATERAAFAQAGSEGRCIWYMSGLDVSGTVRRTRRYIGQSAGSGNALWRLCDPKLTSRPLCGSEQGSKLTWFPSQVGSHGHPRRVSWSQYSRCPVSGEDDQKK